MTQTATTAAPRFIPATGLTAEIDGTTVQAFWVNAAGWKVQTRKDGLTTYSNTHRHEHNAVAEFNALVAKAEAEQATEAPVPIKLAPAAKGTTTRMTLAETTVIGQALDSTGHIRRGRGAAAADLNSLLAMARRGFITLTGPQCRPSGGEVTDWGRRICKEAREAADAQRDRDAKLAAIALIAA